MAWTYEAMALGAAACWAVASLSAVPASAHLGAVAFTRWRMLFASVLLVSLATWRDGWSTLPSSGLGVLALSGFIGIFLGDSALFACMNRLGPRRAGVLFATHALFSAVLAWWWLGDSLSGRVLWGTVLMVTGVMLAIALGKRRGETHHWEQVHGRWWVGVALGLTAALGQSVATLMLKPLMATGVDPVAASAVRMLAALSAHAVLRASGAVVSKAQNPLTAGVLWRTAWNASLAMGLGMTLILWALQGGSASFVAVWSSVTPVLLLPLLWLIYRRQPPLGAWVGAGLTVVGGAAILLR